MRRARASMSLTMVIIITAILVSVGTGVLLLNIDLLNSRRPAVAATTSDFLARSCFEEALRKLNTNQSFTGSVSITVDPDATCIAEITNVADPDVVKNIAITANPTGYTLEYQRRVKITAGEFELIQ